MPLGSSFRALVMWITDIEKIERERKKKKTIPLRRWKVDSSRVGKRKVVLLKMEVDCSNQNYFT